MANTLGLTEVVLLDLADSTGFDAIMVGTDRKVVRVTDHVDDQGAVDDDYTGMAIFECRGRGYPWTKKDNTLASLVHVAPDAVTAVPTGVTTLFPDWDYSTF